MSERKSTAYAIDQWYGLSQLPPSKRKKNLFGNTGEFHQEDLRGFIYRECLRWVEWSHILSVASQQGYKLVKHESMSKVFRIEKLEPSEKTLRQTMAVYRNTKAMKTLVSNAGLESETTCLVEACGHARRNLEGKLIASGHLKSIAAKTESA